MINTNNGESPEIPENNEIVGNNGRNRMLKLRFILVTVSILMQILDSNVLRLLPLLNTGPFPRLNCLLRREVGNE